VGDHLILRACRYSDAGLTTSSQVGHSAQIPVVPSFFSYSTKMHAAEMPSPHPGQRPCVGVSSVIRGGKGACDNSLPIARRTILRCKLCAESYRTRTVANTNSLAPRPSVMAIRTVLTRLLGDTGPTIVIECRHCGTTVTPETETCPECGASEFCWYEIPK